MEGKWTARVMELQAQLDGALRRIESQRVRLVELEAESERLRVDLADLLAAADADALMLTQVGRERDRLAAVLAETPENVEAVVNAVWGGALVSQDLEIQSRTYEKWRHQARQLLAALRAKAGMP